MPAKVGQVRAAHWPDVAPGLSPARILCAGNDKAPPAAGGSGKISGLILGTLFIGILNNALPMIHVSTFWQNFIEGMIILFAVLMGIYVKRQNEKAALKRRKI